MTIDAHGNVHDRTGQFANKGIRAPTSVLSSPPSSPALEAALARRAEAAEAYQAARRVHLAAHRDAAVAVIREQFPWATEATFARNWDEDKITLMSVSDGEQSVELEDEDYWRQAPAGDGSAFHLASIYVSEMGDDVLDYLDDSESDHDGWYEFMLDLSDQADGEVSA